MRASSRSAGRSSPFWRCPRVSWSAPECASPARRRRSSSPLRRVRSSRRPPAARVFREAARGSSAGALPMGTRSAIPSRSSRPLRVRRSRRRTPVTFTSGRRAAADMTLRSSGPVATRIPARSRDFPAAERRSRSTGPRDSGRRSPIEALSGSRSPIRRRSRRSRHRRATSRSPRTGLSTSWTSHRFSRSALTVRSNGRPRSSMAAA